MILALVVLGLVLSGFSAQTAVTTLADWMDPDRRTAPETDPQESAHPLAAITPASELLVVARLDGLEEQVAQLQYDVNVLHDEMAEVQELVGLVNGFDGVRNQVDDLNLGVEELRRRVTQLELNQR